MARELQPPADPTEPAPLVHRRLPGWVVIAGLLTMGAVLAGIGWWSHHTEIYRPRELWGAEHALRIRDARTAETWLLAPVEEAATESPGKDPAGQDVAVIAGQRYAIVKRTNSIAVRGVSDVRRALIADFAFDWEHPPQASAEGWEFVLAMTDDSGRSAIAFDPVGQRVILLETGAAANVAPVAEFFQAFFRRALELPEPGKAAR